MTKSTTIISCLKIDFIVIVIDKIIIIDIVIDKLDFVMTNIYFIFTAIDTCCTTSKFKKTLKTKNKRSIKSLNENCIHQKFDLYEIIKN